MLKTKAMFIQGTLEIAIMEIAEAIAKKCEEPEVPMESACSQYRNS